MLHLIVIPWAQVVCLIYTPEARGPQAQGLRVYIAYKMLHLIVIPWAQVVCLIYTPEARGPQAQGLRVYISGEPQVHMV